AGHGDAIGVDAELVGVRSHPTHRALGVLERGRPGRFGHEAVADGRGDVATGSQQCRGSHVLERVPTPPAAAVDEHDGSAGHVHLGGPIHVQVQGPATSPCRAVDDVGVIPVSDRCGLAAVKGEEVLDGDARGLDAVVRGEGFGVGQPRGLVVAGHCPIATRSYTSGGALTSSRAATRRSWAALTSLASSARFCCSPGSSSRSKRNVSATSIGVRQAERGVRMTGHSTPGMNSPSSASLLIAGSGRNGGADQRFEYTYTGLSVDAPGWSAMWPSVTN